MSMPVHPSAPGPNMAWPAPSQPAPYPQPPRMAPGVPPVNQSGRVIAEKTAFSMPGLLGLVILLAGLGFGVYQIVNSVNDGRGGVEVQTSVLVGVVVVCLILGQSALTIVQPGETKVMQFLGNYIGTIRATGLRLTFPFTSKRRVSVKVRNFETREIKVNDSQGNPVVIGAIIVWQVSDTAQSVFQVEHYEQFVHVQAEAALRHIATIHPYDNGDEGEATLRGATDLVAAELAQEVGERVDVAGVTILETRISSLSYAPEIASAMLQRQQAQAVLAARAKIVEGAVTMVESALDRLEREGIVELDNDRKATMVSNLLVVLCSDSRAMPTVNTGM